MADEFVLVEPVTFFRVCCSQAMGDRNSGGLGAANSATVAIWHRSRESEVVDARGACGDRPGSVGHSWLSDSISRIGSCGAQRDARLAPERAENNKREYPVRAQDPMMTSTLSAVATGQVVACSRHVRGSAFVDHAWARLHDAWVHELVVVGLGIFACPLLILFFRKL
jgi:hypothetical protein